MAEMIDVSGDESEDPQERGEPPQSVVDFFRRDNELGAVPAGRPLSRWASRLVAFTVVALLTSLLLTASDADIAAASLAQDSGSGSEVRPEKSRHRWPGVSGPRMEQRIDAGIRKGLGFLREQKTRDGRFSSDYSVAVTSLSGMAFLGYGAEYLRGEYGEEIYDAVRYLTLVALQDEKNGFIREGSGTPSKMHGHAYAVLFLAQVLGSIDTPAKETEVRKVVTDGVRCIINTQTSRGGWYYTPKQSLRDMDEASITVCCLQALRAAKDAGCDVPKLTIDRAVSYLKECSRKEDGAFIYSLSQGDRSRYSFELTAAAISTLDAAGKYTGDVHSRGVEYMRRVLDKHRRKPLNASPNYPLYGGLYVAQAFHQLGGDAWEDWARPAMEQLLAEQQADGSWKSRFGNAYATAMALLILEVPRGYLPIFER